MKTAKTNTQLKKLIYSLRKQDANLWQRTAKELEKASRKRRDINISKIERFAESGETVLVFGKVLASGDLTKKVTVSALSFSEKARQQIHKAGGSAITIEELMKKNPKGTKVKVIA